MTDEMQAQGIEGVEVEAYAAGSKYLLQIRS